MEMIQEAHQSYCYVRCFPLHFFCNPTTCHHLHPRPNHHSSPHQKNTAIDQVVPYRPVFQTSPATLAQHTRYCHHHWFNQLGPDSPQSWLCEKHVTHPAQMSRAITAGSVKKHRISFTNPDPCLAETRFLVVTHSFLCIVCLCNGVLATWYCEPPPGKCRAV